VVLASESERGPDLLLIKRASKHSDPWSGQMGLPGGRRDKNDTSLLETARRETREETGIDLPLDTLLGELDELAPTTPVLPPVIVRPYVFGLPHRPSTRPSSEVAAIIWTPLSTLEATEQDSEVDVRGTALTVRAYHVGPHVVWGMTHRILKPFIELVR
jgi:8-oxo-dGTP pyrophosphatase MutT (NUDIX family)